MSSDGMWGVLTRGYDFAFDDDIPLAIPATADNHVILETDESHKRQNTIQEEESSSPKRPKLGDYIGVNQSRSVRQSMYSREFTAITENETGVNAMQPAGDDGSLPQCNCRIPAVSRTVVKDGPTKGKGFYACSKNGAEKCNYFQWKDSPPSENRSSNNSNHNNITVNNSETVATPSCLCNEPSIIRVVNKEGPNKGKRFYCCGKTNRDQQCKYFAFVSENASASASTTGESTRTQGSSNVRNQGSGSIATMNCKCNVVAKVLKVKKEGPNMGRDFYTCSTKTCNFFQFV